MTFHDAKLSQTESDLKELKNATLHHFEDDKDSFSEIKDRLDKISESLEEHSGHFQRYAADQEKVHTDIKNEYGELKLAIGNLKSSADPINEWFRNYSFSKRAIIAIMGALGAVVAIAIGIKQLFTK